METYSRGWRGAPAKGVDWETGARVQISLSPPLKKQILYIRIFFVFKNILRYNKKGEKMKRSLKGTIAIGLLTKLILSILLLIPSIFILFVTGMSEYQCIK